jgi:hypothetical protein
LLPDGGAVHSSWVSLLLPFGFPKVSATPHPLARGVVSVQVEEQGMAGENGWVLWGYRV